MKTFLLQSVG